MCLIKLLSFQKLNYVANTIFTYLFQTNLNPNSSLTMPKPKKTITTPTAGPRQETKQIRLILQPTTETGQVVCVSVVGSFDDENHKGFDNPLHDLWMKQPAKLATLFPDPDFIRPYHKKCPCRTSQENNKPLLCSVIPKWGPHVLHLCFSC
jgi:hypothetical protein